MSRRLIASAVVVVLGITSLPLAQSPVQAVSPRSIAAPLVRLRSTLDSYGDLLSSLEGRQLSGKQVLAALEAFAEKAANTTDGCDVVARTQELRQLIASFDPLVTTAQLPGYEVYGPLSQINAALLSVELTALSTLPTEKCGGAANQRPQQAGVRVIAENTAGFDVQVAFPVGSFAPPLVQAVDKDGLGRAGVSLASLHLGSAGQWSTGLGAPSLPVVKLPFGLPDEASAQFTILGVQSVSMDGVALAPFQPEAADRDDGPFSTPPFEFDRVAYGQKRPVLSTPVQVGSIGDLRSMPLSSLRVHGANYTPATRSLQVIRSVTIRVTFSTKGATKFAPVGGTWDAYGDSLTDSLVNSKSIRTPKNRLPDLPVRPNGEEFLIVTSERLRAQALDYANLARERGYVTRVSTYGSAAVGSTKESLQAYVRSHLNPRPGAIRPSYLLLFGDTDQIPTFRVPTPWSSSGWDGLIATDRPYSTSSDDDLVPDLAVGRFPVSDVGTATAMVAKMRSYIDAPPTDPSYYSTAVVTSYFQDDLTGTYAGRMDARGFTRLADSVASHLESDGRTVQRLNTAYDDTDPEYFYDGTAMPAYLQRPTEDWTVADGDFADEIDEGRFFTLHRDHGAPQEVAHPTLTTTDFGSMSNTAELTMLWFIDCSAGKFDNSSTLSIAEVAVRDDAGAVASIAASRDSPTWTNNHMALGMADAIWPTLIPDYGAFSSRRRIGDVMNAGKLYMASRVDSDGASAATVAAEWDLYNLMGDPTFPIRLRQPVQIRNMRAIWRSATELEVRTSPLAVVTAVDSKGEAITRGVASLRGVTVLTIPERRGLLSVTLSASSLDEIPAERLKVSLSTRPR